MNKIDPAEAKWVAAAKNTIKNANKNNPPGISQSEAESLLIGLESLKNGPNPIKLSPEAEKIIVLLKDKVDTMKKKKKRFLPV